MNYDSDAVFYEAAKGAAIYNDYRGEIIQKVIIGFSLMVIGAFGLFAYSYYTGNELLGGKMTKVMGVSYIDENESASVVVSQDQDEVHNKGDRL